MKTNIVEKTEYVIQNGTEVTGKMTNEWSKVLFCEQNFQSFLQMNVPDLVSGIYAKRRSLYIFYPIFQCNLHIRQFMYQI